MTAVVRTLLVLAIDLGVVLILAFVAAALRRRVPNFLLGVVAVLPLIFVGRGVFGPQTMLPVDHAMLTPPWNTRPDVRRYNPYLNDVATQFLPWAKAMRAAWAEGALPLRDRWNGCGTALAANGQSAAFSPLTLLAMTLPLPAAFALLAALKLLLALVGMWLWLKELGASDAAALFGSVCFSFSFAMVPWLFAPQAGVLCLWPWLLFAMELLRDRDVKRRAFVLLLCVLTFLPLAGHIESAACGILFAALWIMVRWIRGDLAETPRIAARFGAAALMAACLTAFSLLPQTLAIFSSNRIAIAQRPFWSQFFSWRPHGPAWTGGVYTSVLPRALGDGIASPIVIGAAASFPEMALGYIGIIGWACALLVLRPGRRNPAALPLMVLAGLGFGVATAIWPFAEVAGHLPLLRYVFPVRFLSWVALSGTALAALELDRLCADLRRTRRAGGSAAVLAALLAIWVAMVAEHVRPRHGAAGLASQREALLLAEVSLAVFAAFALLASGRRGRLAWLLPYGLAAAGGAELWIQGARLYRYGGSDQLYPPTPLVGFLRSRASPFRVIGESSVLFPNSNVFAGVEDVRTHDPVERRDYVEFLDATCGYPPGDYFKFLRDLNAPALNFLNVRYLVSIPGRGSPGEKWRLVYSGNDGTVYENRDVEPRVFAPRRVAFVTAAGSQRSWVRNGLALFGSAAPAIARISDWREKAFVLGPEAGETRNGRADVSGYKESTNGASFQVRVAGGQAFLVTSLVQDGGWSARDEAGAPIGATLANGPFLALRVPEGDRRILLKYRPPGFGIGLLASAAGLLAAVAGIVRARRTASSLTVR